MYVKQNIRLWFEFYKLALTDPDPKVRTDVEASREFYRQWGDCLNVSFNQWWRTHSHLFDEVVISVITEIDGSRNAVFLKVPLVLPITDLVERFKKVISKKQEAYERRSKKSSGASLGTYSLTPDVEFRSGRNYDALIIYRDVYLKLNKPPINLKFLESVQKLYASRKAKKFNKVPSALAGRGVGEESALRTCRRYIADAKRLVHAAAKGDFPGKKLPRKAVK
ncbi:hypothetical protein [uncultured Sulfuricurvum sp.]|uniref:hypothetical protein n=1 Tax=uncultured Sulfuricurvum sp. TaxID=430693 RepID=UPI0026377D2A|nr:hypothetical protein [uncultured Sulfuricurvum sp.]